MRGRDTTVLHASCVALSGRALLILGKAGSGKSTLALELMARGAALVADDRVVLRRTPDGIAAAAPEPIRGLVEARGIGLLHAEAVDGAILTAVVDLDQTEIQRLPPQRSMAILGQSLPLLHKVDSPGFPAALVQYLRVGRKDAEQ
ncbi:HPr kinase/phosphatase C-terminal domain-containing protein [Aestuariicoccus sp. MJ-SS9]|uniref:HPr kinase/phosphorylase n=1 Tax=Aestuariicoccus sp. MJ-SS9 TaxID=3079855 RepID=UPI002913FCC7|nr:HPr kinase/phosphatase C-terminal domain-containing protein [Aestuariicoccus sp. MJ-SS9]MDU8911721.1 HPr kinase/phosphatase C-terminal domain-containing protein [Aestuariicoccus sp. MJ-SS9]